MSDGSKEKNSIKISLSHKINLIFIVIFGKKYKVRHTVVTALMVFQF